MIYLFTGNGKGKTTAALGQAIRTLGDGKKVLMIQFIKGPWISGEDKIWKKLYPDFEIIKGGKGFIGIMGDKLPRIVHEKAAEETLEKFCEAINSNKYDLVVADEIHNALYLNLIKIDKVLKILKNAPQDIDIILTGRNAPRKLLDLADLVTEMKEIKHPYNTGKKGKFGLEF